MQCLIIGYGSIGKRHAEVCKDLGCSVIIVTSQTITDFPSYSTIEKALEAESVDYVVIANATHLHYATLTKLIELNYQGVVLVEKPLFSKMEQLPANNLKILVAYNLRFHELLIKTKELIQDQTLISFSTYVGQYLPTWRKGVDYRTSYSAKKAAGGGVLRDLSHELDYSIWLCGPCSDVTAIGGQFSNLEIDSDDIYSIMMKCKACPVVNVQVNYLDRKARREIIINTHQDTVCVDFIQGTLTVNEEQKYKVTDATPKSYFHQHQALLNKNYASFCHYQDGQYLMKLIEAIETAATAKCWVTL